MKPSRYILLHVDVQGEVLPSGEITDKNDIQYSCEEIIEVQDSSGNLKVEIHKLRYGERQSCDY